MKKILSLCIHFVLLIISDADPLKLIAGERSVVKKDGATHTISKYYVVPNDYDPNNVTNTTAATQHSSLRIHNLNSKTMDSGSINEAISDNKATTVNNQSDSDITFIKMNNQVKVRPDVKVGHEVSGTESTVSMSAEQTLDSNNLEPDGRQASDSLYLEERSQSGDSDSNDFIEMSDDPDSNEATVSNNEPSNVLRHGLSVPYNFSVPDAYNVISSATKPTLNDVARYNDIQDDPNSIHTIPDSIETVKHLDDEPVSVESIFANVPPLTNKSRTADNFQWNMENETIEYFPWPNPTTPNDGLTWHIEDKRSHPLTNVEQITSDKVPWNIESKIAKKGIKKPYHIYTYVIKPTATLPEVPNADNDLHVVSKHPYRNLETTLYGLPTLHDENKITYKMQPPQSHYESQFSLSKPTIDISSQPSNSQVTHHVTTTYDQSHKANPSTLHSQTPQEDNEPQYLVESEQNHKLALLQTNTHHLESQPNSGEEKEAPTVPEIDSPHFKTYENGNLLESPLSRNDIADQHAKPNSLNYDIGNQIQPSSYPGMVNKASAHSSVQISQHPGFISSSASSFTNTYGLKKPVQGGQIYQPPDAISITLDNSKYTNVQNDNNIPTLVNGGDTNNDPGHIDESVYGGQVYQQPGTISIASANSKYTTVQNDNNLPTLVNGGNTNNDPRLIGEPVYGGQVYQQPGAISIAPANSQYTTVQNDNNIPSLVNGGDTNKNPGHIDEPVYGGQVYQQPGTISIASANSKYTTVQNDNNIPSLVNGGDTDNNPGQIDEPVYGGQVYQQPGAISIASANSQYTTTVPTLVNGGNTNSYPGYIVKATAHSEYTNVPTHYGLDTNAQLGLISEAHQQNVYPNVVDDFDDSIPLNGVQIKKHPDYISKAHSKFTIPVNYNAQTHDEDEIKFHPVKIQSAPNYPKYSAGVNHYFKVKPVNGGSTQNGDNYLLPYQPNGHKVHVIKHPFLIKPISGKQNRKLEPTYRLFTQKNLHNLQNAIIKTIQTHGVGVYDDRALIYLKNIINVILVLAENLEETDGSNAWYEKIFYNSQDSQHPLQHYVYNLIRQRWLHELMLLMFKNNFNIKILQNPGMFSFLETWQLPKYVQNYMKANELIHVLKLQNYKDISNNQKDFTDKYSTHTYDDFIEAPGDLAKFVTQNIIDNYKTHNEGIILSIAGVEAEPDAKAIINILKKYLQNKNYIETQENVIIRDNKLEMLKQIILFLRTKGYGANIIADLIRKLNTAVNSTEGQGCKAQSTNFAKNMYDVILPVLRRSGQ